MQKQSFIPIDIEREMQDSFLEYAMSVIVSRALPDVRDGLKPVHRRVLYSMWDSGIRPGTPYRKASRVVGELVMEELRELDEVAFVRFASVYRRFQDVTEFQEEINRLRDLTDLERRRNQLSLLPDEKK